MLEDLTREGVVRVNLKRTAVTLGAAGMLAGGLLVGPASATPAMHCPATAAPAAHSAPAVRTGPGQEGVHCRTPYGACSLTRPEPLGAPCFCSNGYQKWEGYVVE